MTRWRTDKHFTSWLTLAPKNKISGARLISSKTQPSANRAAAILRMCAMVAGRTSTALGAYYRRIAYRIGKPKAITATARKIAILVYRLLRGDLDYRDPGAEAYEAHHRTHTVQNRRSRARQLGFGLINLETGELLQGAVSSEPAVHSAPLPRSSHWLHLIIQARTETVLFQLEVIASLEIHPELLSHTEIPRQAKSRIRSDRPLAVHDLVDASRWHVDVLGKAVLADSHRLEELLQENLTRMNGVWLFWHRVT